MSEYLLRWLRDMLEAGHWVRFCGYEFSDSGPKKSCTISFHVKPQLQSELPVHVENQLLKYVWLENADRSVGSKINSYAVQHPDDTGKIYSFFFPDHYENFLKKVRSIY